MQKLFFAAGMVLVLAIGLIHPATAQDLSFTIEIKDHKFSPSQIEIPAGTKAKLLVKNLDKTPEEFESHDLRREKVIPGGKEATILIGPLKPGTYKFVGEYNESTAKGEIIVK